MRKPRRPCFAECPGWGVFEVDGQFEINRCDECWADEPRAPSDAYFQKQPECRAKLAEEQAAQGLAVNELQACERCPTCGGSRMSRADQLILKAARENCPPNVYARVVAILGARGAELAELLSN